VDAAEQITGQQLFPLLERDQHQGGCWSVFENQPGIVLPGFDVKDVPEVHFHEFTFMTDKEE
jgi:hypothetical protein